MGIFFINILACIIILSVVLYSCEILSLTLTEEHTLRVFEKRTLKRIYVPKKGEIIGKR
jgi:hypothetical protein